MSIRTRSIRAYRIGDDIGEDNPLGRYISVPTLHQGVSRGLSLPRVTAVFETRAHVVVEYWDYNVSVADPMEARERYAVYYTRDIRVYPRYNRAIHYRTRGLRWFGEFLVFKCSAAQGRRLVNMRTGDNEIAWQIVLEIVREQLGVGMPV